MNKNIVAKQAITINAPVAKVWDALINPDMLRQFMFAEVVSDWKEGSPIVFRGEYQGRAFEDKGKILRFEPGWVLEYSHFSPLAGLPDVPENYHTVTYTLVDEGKQTRLELSQDKNATDEERQHAEQFWGQMLATLKSLLEQ